MTMRPSIDSRQAPSPDAGSLSSLRRNDLVDLHSRLLAGITDRFPEAGQILAAPVISSESGKPGNHALQANVIASHDRDDLMNAPALARKLGLSVGTIRGAVVTGRIRPVSRPRKKGPGQQLFSLLEACQVFANTLRHQSMTALGKEELTSGLMSFEEIAAETGIRLEQIRYAARCNKLPGYRQGRKLFARLADVEAALVPDRLHTLFERKVLQAEIRLMQLWLANSGTDDDDRASASHNRNSCPAAHGSA
uniref:Uncharacterized protein n=1 Tax=Ochrobactrum sp. LM19 TaxID=1449781 RepID=A0A0D5A1E9_9HYPH|nr:hypothetical protein [Ochrobactrum sp. LM19]AJW30006.1 hypothetical protein pLM19O2_p61 [Ochrobactrum sp. LM19]